MKQRFEVRKHGAVLGYVLERPSGFWFNSRCQHGNSRRGWATPELAVAKLPEVTLHKVGSKK